MRRGVLGESQREEAKRTSATSSFIVMIQIIFWVLLLVIMTSDSSYYKMCSTTPCGLEAQIVDLRADRIGCTEDHPELIKDILPYPENPTSNLEDCGAVSEKEACRARNCLKLRDALSVSDDAFATEMACLVELRNTTTYRTFGHFCCSVCNFNSEETLMADWSMRKMACGFFRCNLGHKPQHTTCSQRSSHIKAAQAFFGLGAAFMGLAMVIHIADSLIKEEEALSASTRMPLPRSFILARKEIICRIHYLHGINAVFFFFAAVLSTAAISRTLCGSQFAHYVNTRFGLMGAWAIFAEEVCVAVACALSFALPPLPPKNQPQQPQQQQDTQMRTMGQRAVSIRVPEEMENNGRPATASASREVEAGDLEMGASKEEALQIRLANNSPWTFEDIPTPRNLTRQEAIIKLLEQIQEGAIGTDEVLLEEVGKEATSIGSCRGRAILQASGSGNRDSIWGERMQQLEELLNQHRVALKRMADDGNCQFRAVAYTLYNTEESHNLLRLLATSEMATHREKYQDFVDPSEYDQYVNKMKTPGVWGDELTLRALSEALRITIHVFSLGDDGGLTRSTYRPSVERERPLAMALGFISVHYNALVLQS